MKPTKMRNLQMYKATNRTRNNQLGCILAKDLRKKYGRRTVRVVKGDAVKVMRGEYKGIDGKVVKISLDSKSIAIEGIKKEKSKGDKIDIYIQSSNVMITGLNREDSWRKNRIDGKSKKAVSKPEPSDTAEKKVTIDEIKKEKSVKEVKQSSKKLKIAKNPTKNKKVSERKNG